MKLSGHLTLEIVNEITGEIVNTIEQDNIITDIAYKSIYGDPVSISGILDLCYWAANYIFISTETATPVRTKTSIQCSGTAYQGSGQPPIQVFHNANPPYFIITQRLDSLSSPRTFQTVGLTATSVGQNVNTTVIPYAYLLLNTPCTQEANQIVNLTYRITVQETSLTGVYKPSYPRWINDVCYSLVYSSDSVLLSNAAYLFNMAASAPLPSYNWKYLYVASELSQMQSPNNVPPYLANGINITGQNSLFYRQKYYWEFLRNNNAGQLGANGRILNGLLSGVNRVLKTAAVEPDPGLTRSAHSSNNLSFSSSLQSAFSYSASPSAVIGPMFLPDNNPSGTGIIQFTEDPWTGTWPTVYRVRITDSGNVGTAKFVLGVKQFTGYYSDSNYTYTNSTKSFHPYVYAFIQPYDKCHGWQMTMPILAWDDKWTVQADWTGLSLINQFTGQHYDFDSTTSSALPITNFRQFALDVPNNLIYVACSATGLWKLDITNKASVVITHESTNPTYAVDVSASGVVYAFMNISGSNLTLTSSTSSYVTDLNFTGTSLTTSSWLNIYVNKYHADTRIAITVKNNITNYNLKGAYVYWWDLVNGTSSNNYTTDVVAAGESQVCFAWVNKSDNRFWAYNGSLFSYNSSSLINPAVGKRDPINIQTNLGAINYDSDSYKLLSGVQIPTTGNRYVPVAACQDYWGFLLPKASLTTGELYNPSTGVQENSYNHSIDTNYGASTYSYKRVVLTNGITLSDVAAYYLYDNGSNNAINRWIWYKWDGSNWVKAVNYDADTNTWTDTTSTSTRTTSTSYLPLLDGINIRFQNGTSGTSFLVNEVYDQYVCKGILKTNDTYIFAESSVIYSQPVYEQVTITPTVITSGHSYGVVVDKAPGNLGISSAVSAITVDPLWYSIIPEYNVNVMHITINSVEVSKVYSETIDTLPAQSSLNSGEVIVYRNGLILCATADATKTLGGYFSYVAKSD